MGKSIYYFSHDSNARNDEKLLAVRMRFGAEGYGIYFMILERLMDSRDYLSVKDYNIIAFDFRVSSEKVKSIVEDFGLFVFTEDGKHFYSESFLNRIPKKVRLLKYRKEKGIRVRMYNTNVKKWYKIIQQVFKRDNYTCKYCGVVGGKLEADHIIPFSKGGSDELDNLTTSCRRCNRQKKDKSLKEFKIWHDQKKAD